MNKLTFEVKVLSEVNSLNKHSRPEDFIREYMLVDGKPICVCVSDMACELLYAYTNNNFDDGSVIPHHFIISLDNEIKMVPVMIYRTGDLLTFKIHQDYWHLFTAIEYLFDYKSFVSAACSAGLEINKLKEQIQVKINESML